MPHPSNGLVANPSKTEFILLNNKENSDSKKRKVDNSEGDKVKSPKLLGIKMDNDQKWTSHFWGKKDSLQP